MRGRNASAMKGKWWIYEDVGDAKTRAVTVASFDRDSFVPLRSGFLGISESALGRTELWPSSRFSGLIVCEMGSVTKQICVLPAPHLVWSLNRQRSIVLERRPFGSSAFGDSHCRALGTDSNSNKFTRTVWGLNGQTVVAASERTMGRVTFHWSEEIMPEVSVNSTSMALSLRPSTKDSTICVTCIAGIGENILSLPVTECRNIKGHSKTVRTGSSTSIRCSCINQYVFSAVCSASLMFSVYGLTRTLVNRHPKPAL